MRNVVGQVTGFGYEHDALWSQNMAFFKHFTDKSQGVRRLGAAAIDLCHVALGESAADTNHHFSRGAADGMSKFDDGDNWHSDTGSASAGVVYGFWEYRLKPWDVAAGVLMVREAGGLVTDMEGGAYSVFSRSTLATNGVIHNSIVSVTGPKTAALTEQEDLTPWFIPSGYKFETQ